MASWACSSAISPVAASQPKLRVPPCNICLRDSEVDVVRPEGKMDGGLFLFITIIRFIAEALLDIDKFVKVQQSLTIKLKGSELRTVIIKPTTLKVRCEFH